MNKKNYASRNIRGKLRVCNYLLSEEKLRQHIPRTVSFNKENLEMMIGRFKSLYIKPDVGSLGIGIFKLRRRKTGFELQEIVQKQQVTHRFDKISGVMERIQSAKKGNLIIQQAILLDRVNNQPYDVRAMVQRKPGGSWVCSGFLVKVGAANKIVTNYYQGGKIITLKKLDDQRNLSDAERERRTRKLTATALDIAQALSKRRAGMHEMGIDFAWDKNRRLWVLEVNSNHPQFHPLRQIDRQAYDKMKYYAASYGRHSAK